VKNTDKLQVHTNMHTTMHKWEWHAFVDQSDTDSKWMHKLVQATQCVVQCGKVGRLTYIILSGYLSKGDRQQNSRWMRECPPDVLYLVILTWNLHWIPLLSEVLLTAAPLPYPWQLLRHLMQLSARGVPGGRE